MERPSESPHQSQGQRPLPCRLLPVVWSGPRRESACAEVRINWVRCGDPPHTLPLRQGLLELQSPPLYSDGGNNRPFSGTVERLLMKEPPFLQSLHVRSPGFTGGPLQARPPTELYTGPVPFSPRHPPPTSTLAPFW